MRLLKNLPVSAKLQGLVAWTLVGVAVVGALGFCVQRDLRTSAEDVGRAHLPAARAGGTADRLCQGLRAAALRALVASGNSDAAGAADARAELDEVGKQLRASLAALDALPLANATRAEFAKVESELDAYVAGAARIVELASGGAHADALAELPALDARFERLAATNVRLRDLFEADADAALREAEQRAVLAGRVTWGVVAALFVMTLGLGRALARTLSRPLRAAVLALESGESSKLVAVDASDEIGRMTRAAHTTLARMEQRTAELVAEKRTLEQAAKAAAENARRLAAQYEDAERNARLAATEAARVASMVENSPACVLYVDRDSIVRYVNSAAKAALSRVSTGFRTPQFVGEPLERFYRHPEGNPSFFGKRSNLPFESRFESGAHTIDLVASAICDPAGQMLGVMLTWRLVTERVAAERGMKATQARELEQAHELESRVDRLLAAVDAAAKGDLTVEITIEGDDAVGRMGEGLTRLLADLRSSISRIRANAEKLAGASKTLTSVSAEMNTEAAATSEQASVVSSVTTQLSENVRTVASGTEQMSNSIQEISRNTSEAASVARRAVTVAEETNAAVSRLGQSSEEIGKILKVITSIAQQTNLLALNATIEAARAGSAGKGFAVVANEVKELAKETAKATEDIRGKIDAIQTDTTGAVAAIGQIGEIIRAIDQLQTSIAGAVEQQHATTQEINGNLNDAARGSGQIVESITQMACSAHATKTGAGNSSKVSSDVSSMAGELLQLVDRFKC